MLQEGRQTTCHYQLKGNAKLYIGPNDIYRLDRTCLKMLNSITPGSKQQNCFSLITHRRSGPHISRKSSSRNHNNLDLSLTVRFSVGM